MRDDFELDEKIIYLNSGTHSIVPRATLDAIARHQREFERNPTDGLMRAWGRLWEVQKQLAAFLGSRPEDIFLTTSATTSLHTGILGLPLPARSEIAVTDLEYTAIANVARYRAEREGHSLRSIHIPASGAELALFDEQTLVDQVVEQLTPATRMLVVSHVATGNGLVLPVRRLAAETRRRGVLLVVDGAHATGALDMSFTELGDVDFYGGNLHKWVLGPKGTAFGWVAPRHHETIATRFPGWTTYETPEPFSAFGGGSRYAARMLESACQDFAPWFALPAALAFWTRHGAGRIRARLHALQKHAEKRMAERLDWRVCSPPFGPLRGPLLSYDLPERLEGEGYGLMIRLYRDTAIQISVTRVQGLWRARLSPHVYNTEAEIDRAVEAFSRL
jgi:isopenicillin-N epimerase